MERIRIDDGSKTYEIVNQDDKVLGTFTFNPADVGGEHLADVVEAYGHVLVVGAVEVWCDQCGGVA